MGEASDVSILHGKLVHHDELRQWLGLKMDNPACGENEVQLVFSDPKAWRRADSLRECRITVNGKLYYSPTSYYSTNMAISDGTVKPDTSCRPLPIEPDLSAADIAPAPHAYNVSITVDYRGKGRVEVKVWKGENPRSLLEPWQAYTHYFLNGSADYITFGCREGFRLKDITQTPKSSSGIILDDPNSASTGFQDLEAANTIIFICDTKSSEDAKPKSPKAEAR